MRLKLLVSLEKQDMGQYELMVILTPQNGEADSGQKELEEALDRLKAEIIATDDWGEKQMSYPINGYDRGHYLVYQLNLSPKSAAQLRQRFQLVKNLMRWLLLSVDAKEVAAKKAA